MLTRERSLEQDWKFFLPIKKLKTTPKEVWGGKPFKKPIY